MIGRVRVALALLATGCGRLDFSPLASDAGGGISSDAADATAGDARIAGLVLHVTFEGPVVVDEVSGDTGLCTNCPAPSSGRIGTGAATFDGVNDCVHFTNRVAFEAPHVTSAIWMNATSTNEVTMLTKPTSGDANTWELVRMPTRELFHFHWSGTNDGWATGIIIPDNEWHHVAFTYDGVTRRVYVDGVARGQMPTNAMVFDPVDLYVGCDVNIGVEGFFYGGALDEIRVYDRALSPAEIATLAMP